jgi:outer membrane receptor protein involved in Fe transport
MMTTPLPIWPRLRAAAQSAADRRTYDLPAADAARALKLFSEQSGRTLIADGDLLRGVTTNAVQGQHTPQDAVDRMLLGTALLAVPDARTGAFVIKRAPGPNAETARADSPRAAASSPAAPAAAAAPSAAPVQLSPFEVSTEKDLGYQSTATMSGTRTGELLRNMPVSVAIINQELLNDVGLTDVMQAMALYGVGVEQNGEPGIGLSGINGGGNSLSFRGIGSSWQGRDGFIWYGVSDSFNVETLEISRGPSGNVFGDSRAGGLPNIVSKRARTQRNFGNVKLSWDSEGGKRGTLDWNRQLTSKAAVRLNLLKSDMRDWRDTAFDQRDGVGAAVQFDFTRNTRLSVVGEYNNVTRVPTHGILTIGYDNGYTLGTGSNGTAAPAGTEVLQAANVNGVQRWTFIGGQHYNLTSTATYLSRVSAATPAARQEPVPQTLIGRNMMWNGPTQQFSHDANSLTVNLDHQLTPTTPVQGSYNLTLSDRFDHIVTIEGSSVRRDVNPTLRTTTGAIVPNPNFDQLYVEHNAGHNQYYNRTAHYRLTAVQDFDFGFTKQRAIVNGTVRDDRFRLVNRGERFTPATITALGFTGAAALPNNHPVRRRQYLRFGNDEQLRHLGNDAYYWPETTGGQKTRAFFYSASALVMGKYWQDRIITMAGVRRDNYEGRAVRVIADPATGLGILEKGGSNDEQWREQAGIFGTSWNYGAVISPQKTWRVFYNFAENFQQAGTAPYFNGEPRQPRRGDGYDYGFSTYLWNDRFTATVTRFNNKANNENQGALTAEVADEINRLLGTSYNVSVAGDTRARRASGTEVEVVANLRPITLRFAYSMRKNVNTDFAPRLVAVLNAMKARTTNTALYALTQARYDAILVEDPSSRASWNYTVRYDFARGPLKGARLGSYGSYRQGRWVYPAGRPPLYFESYIPIGVFASYEWKIADRYRAEVQLNVDNLLDDQTRLGSGYTGFSYLAPRKFTLASTLKF